MRAHLTGIRYCYLHSHRVVKTACARCKTPYCDECLNTRDTGLFAKIVARDDTPLPPLFCDRCVGEVEALEMVEAARRRPLYQRLRPTRVAMWRAGIWLLVLTVMGVPMSLAVRDMAQTVITPEELGRIKLALSRGYLGAEGINLVGDTFHGRVIHATARSQPGHEPTRLIDGWAVPEVPAWRSADAALPTDLAFALGQRAQFNTVLLHAHSSEPPETLIRDYEIHVSDDPDRGFRMVASGSMLPSTIEKIRFDAVAARFILLRIRSTQGSSPY
ncbi:MAG TPA: hypothetical protein VGW38_27470, partial [Chloroflexota bacterium]|nr:hypothetical protein [Chloroflexota bacterium]